MLQLFKNSIVREIQSEILADEAQLSNILRKARLAARKLDLAEFEKWISNESDGYRDTAWIDLPDYRRIGATPRFFNPYRGWCPIIIRRLEAIRTLPHYPAFSVYR